MIKKYKWQLIITSLVILLPMLFGAFGGRILPEEIAKRLGFGSGGEGIVPIFLILPAILLVMHWICTVITVKLDKNAEQNKKMMNVVLWIIPVISLTSCGVIITSALGYTAHIYAVILAVIGIPFIIIGNYMPKTTRNITMGIKIKWTLSSDENWNATHRFAGKVYVACGFLCFLAMPLPNAAFPFVCIALILACAILPVIYSYRFYKKQLAEGKLTKEDCRNAFGELVGPKGKKVAVILTVAITLALAILLPVVMFAGNIEVSLDGDSLNVEATFWSDLELSYEQIDSIEYRKDGVAGTRVSGFGSAKLLLGTFTNGELGMHTRYTEGNCPCVIIKADGRSYVIGVKDEATVKQIYDRISAEIAD